MHPPEQDEQVTSADESADERKQTVPKKGGKDLKGGKDGPKTKEPKDDEHVQVRQTRSGRNEGKTKHGGKEKVSINMKSRKLIFNSKK